MTCGGADALALFAIPIGLPGIPEPFCFRGVQGNTGGTPPTKSCGLESVPPESLGRAGNLGGDCGHDLVPRTIGPAGVGGGDHHQPGPSNLSGPGTQSVDSRINCHSGGWWRDVGILSGPKLGTATGLQKGLSMFEVGMCIGCLVVGFILGMVHKQQVIRRLTK